MSIICVLPVIAAFYDLLATLRVPFGAFDAIWNAFDTVLGFRSLLDAIDGRIRRHTGPLTKFGTNLIGVIWRHLAVSTSIQAHSTEASQTPRKAFRNLKYISRPFEHIWTPPALLTPSISVFSIFRNAFGRCSGILAIFVMHLDAVRGFWHISQRI